MKKTWSKLLALGMITVSILMPRTAFAAKLPCGHADTEPGDHKEACCGIPGHYRCDGKTHGLVCYGLAPGDKRPEKPPVPLPDSPEDQGGNENSQEDANVNAAWCLSGVDQCSFTMPGMPGSGKCIIYMYLYKCGSTNPAGTYTGYLNIWYTEMTPELMKQSGIIGDSYNEREDNFFSIDMLPWDDEWPYSSGYRETIWDFISITDVTVFGRRQNVIDQPDVDIGYSISMDPQIGAVQVNVDIGTIHFASNNFYIDYSPTGFEGDGNPNAPD